MTGCCAFGCSSNSEKGFLMKRFPRDPARRKLWAIKVKRENWTPTNSSCLCELHFTPDMFEQNRVDGKRMLKRDAVPTLFAHVSTKESRKPPKERENPPTASNLLDETIISQSSTSAQALSQIDPEPASRPSSATGLSKTRICRSADLQD